MKKLFWIVLLLLVSVTVVEAQNLDINLLSKLNKPEQNHLPFWKTVSNSVYWVPSAYAVSNLAYGLAANDNEALRYSLETTMSVGISMALTFGIKKIVGRPRPAKTYPNLIQTYSVANDASFPSGHTAAAFATATTMMYQNNKWYISVPIIVWPISIGYSRMRLGKHYPSDVLVGILIGVGSGLLSHWLTNEMVH